MAARSIASLSLSFGLVSIPIKLYSATESSAAIRFKLMASGGGRLRQQYVEDHPAAPSSTPDPTERPAAAHASEASPSRIVRFPGTTQEDDPVPRHEPVDEPEVVERSAMVKGYEFEKGKYVLFTAEELKALEAGSRKTIDIEAFVPISGVDPIYYDKAYFLAPDKRGAKPYSLLLRALRETDRCAIGKWAFRSKEYVVQIRPADGGMVLQQLLYADEVRSLADLEIDRVEVGDAELALAKQLIERASADTYDPALFTDEEKQRILAAVEKKIAGQQIVAPEEPTSRGGAQVLDLMEALRASLRQTAAVRPAPKRSSVSELPLAERKPVKRAPRRSVPEPKAAEERAKR